MPVACFIDSTLVVSVKAPRREDAGGVSISVGLLLIKPVYVDC